MSAVMGIGVLGLSARYAAQIRDLIDLQAERRALAEERAAREQAQAARDQRVEAAREDQAAEAVRVDIRSSKVSPAEAGAESETQTSEHAPTTETGETGAEALLPPLPFPGSPPEHAPSTHAPPPQASTKPPALEPPIYDLRI
ncbi:MAG: hypothetical protein R3C52_04950 [Hyphomonadaceae bacterium]